MERRSCLSKGKRYTKRHERGKNSLQIIKNGATNVTVGDNVPIRATAKLARRSRVWVGDSNANFPVRVPMTLQAPNARWVQTSVHGRRCAGAVGRGPTSVRAAKRLRASPPGYRAASLETLTVSGSVPKDVRLDRLHPSRRAIRRLCARPRTAAFGAAAGASGYAGLVATLVEQTRARCARCRP